MTQKEFLAAASTNTLTEEHMQYAAEQLQKLNERAASVSAAKNAEDAPLIEAVTALLTNAPRAYTAAEIAAHIGKHTSKATAICKKIPNIRVTDVQVDRRMVKGYSL